MGVYSVQDLRTGFKSSGWRSPTLVVLYVHSLPDRDRSQRMTGKQASKKSSQPAMACDELRALFFPVPLGALRRSYFSL